MIVDPFFMYFPTVFVADFIGPRSGMLCLSSGVGTVIIITLASDIFLGL